MEYRDHLLSIAKLLEVQPYFSRDAASNEAILSAIFNKCTLSIGQIKTRIVHSEIGLNDNEKHELIHRITYINK